MFPCTATVFSSGVPNSRLFEANAGRSERIKFTEKWPSVLKIMQPSGSEPNASNVVPSLSTVAETRIHVPTSCSVSLLCSATDLLGTKLILRSLMSARTGSIRLDAGELHHLGPLFDF